MRPCCLTLSSKNLQSIKKFLLFWENDVESKIHIAKKNLKGKKKRQILTILKSPHVNKTAQEQFEYRTYSRHLWIYSTQHFNYLVLLKKIKINLFPDIRMKIKFFSNIKDVGKTETKILNPDNFLGNFYKSSSDQSSSFKNAKRYKSSYKELLENTRRVVRVMDVFGELLIKHTTKISLDSSVAEQRTENPWVGGSNPPLNKIQ